MRTRSSLHGTRWSTRDLIIACSLSLTYGLLWLCWTPLYTLVDVALTPVPMLGEVLKETLKGFWYGAGVLVAYIIRRPGAAVLGETAAALVEMQAWGLHGLSMGLVQGASSEAVFALVGRYRKYRTFVLMLAGGFPAMTTFFWQYWLKNYGHFPLWVQLGKLGVRVASGMVLGGLVAKFLGDLLIHAHVVQPPVRESQS